MELTEGMAGKYVDSFCILTQKGPHEIADSFQRAEELLWGASRVDEEVKFICSELLHERIARSGTWGAAQNQKQLKCPRVKGILVHLRKDQVLLTMIDCLMDVWTC